MPLELNEHALAWYLSAFIILAPLGACAIIGIRMLLGRGLSERATAAIAGVPTGLTWVASIVLAMSYHGHGAALTLDYGAWFSVAGHEFRVTLLVDPLALVMLLVSTSIVALVGRFSVRYLHREPGFQRFFLLMSVFNSGMSLLVLAGSYDLLIGGWEMVGIASMLLIAFFNQRRGPIAGAVRAMISYRVADVGLLSAGVLLHDYLGSAEFSAAFHGGRWPHPGSHLPDVGATIVVLALLLAVMGKSAQFPLSGWLPRAMEGPTPSSALFYGALSVHAGVYLLLRSAPLIESTVIGSVAIGCVGALSAISATLIGRTQSDAKNGLAYATITQVGLMLVGISLHLWVWVVFHMVAHACLRLLQLLRAPSALHDALALQAALRGRPKPRPFFLMRWLPERTLSRLYFLSRHRFFIDTWVYRLFLAPVVQIGRACDVFEQAVFLNARSESGVERGRIAFLYTARALSLLLMAITVALAMRCLRGDPLVIVPGYLVVDEVSALFLPLSALVGAACLFASPMRELTTTTLLSVGTALFGSMLSFAAQSIGVFTLGWVVSLVGVGCALPASARLRRMYAMYVALGTLPLLVALAILEQAHITSFVPGLVHEGELTVRAQHIVFALLAVSAAFRSGLFPMHSWLPALSQRAPVAASALLFGAQLGPVLVSRAFGPFTPSVAEHDMSTFATWALASAVFTALLGLMQGDMKRGIGFVLSSQSALLLFGLCDSSLSTRHGALLGALAVGLTGAGLLLVTALLADREQTSDTGALAGRGLRYPRLSALFFLLASAAIGLPGSLHFVAEDLLLHGLLHVSPHLAIILLLVSVLNAIALLRLFFNVFQGPTRERNLPAATDLKLRKAAVIGGLLMATMLSGLAPDWLLTLQERSVHVGKAQPGPTLAINAQGGDVVHSRATELRP